MGNYIEAKADLEIANKINPGDIIITEELRYVEEKLLNG
jgi:uncharacterized protein YaiI (UPF0178 family)